VSVNGANSTSRFFQPAITLIQRGLLPVLFAVPIALLADVSFATMNEAVVEAGGQSGNFNRIDVWQVSGWDGRITVHLNSLHQIPGLNS
jgi:hypothetical protein